MNKSELIDAIAASADISKATAGKALDAVIDSVTGALKAGDDVVLVGFGTFSVRTDRRAALAVTRRPVRRSRSKPPRFQVSRLAKA